MNSTIKIEHFASFRINKTIVKKNLKYLKHNLIVTNKKKRNEKFEEILSDITLCESDYEIWNGFISATILIFLCLYKSLLIWVLWIHKK